MSECKYCATPVGEAVKVQPQNVDDDIFCPTCFVWHRAPAEPNRFHAAGVSSVHCNGCGWDSVSFASGPGVPGGRRTCGHCRSTGALDIRPTTAAIQAINAVGAMIRERR